MTNTLLNLPHEIDEYTEHILSKFGFDQEGASSFNFALIEREEDDITYCEWWILSNASYDYEAGRFVKVNLESSSFGIQIQASGVYPGEHELGYDDIMGINIWRNPIRDQDHEFRDTTTYDYTDCDEHNYIGALHRATNKWREFGVASGWSNNLMTDSFGGVTIGGAGFEVDGNGVFPFTRVTSSVGYVNGTKYYLLGLLDNAYHASTSNWDCDDNKHYSWFVGFLSPQLKDGNNNEVYLTKDLSNAKFVVMYNDTSENSNDIHDMDNTKWHIILEVSATGVKGMINNSLTTFDIPDISGKENTSNKSSSITTDANSTTKYPTTKAVKDYIDSVIGNANTWLTS